MIDMHYNGNGANVAPVPYCMLIKHRNRGQYFDDSSDHQLTTKELDVTCMRCVLWVLIDLGIDIRK